jgi:hypothetical protein
MPEEVLHPSRLLLEALRNHLDDDLSVDLIERLPRNELHVLNDIVRQWEEHWSPPALGKDEFRAYVDARISGLVEGRLTLPADHALVAALLYSHTVAIPSPLYGSPDGAHWQDALRSIALAAPLLDSGVLILVPGKAYRPMQSGGVISRPVSAEDAPELDAVRRTLVKDPEYWHFAQDKPGHPEGDWYADITAEMHTEKHFAAAAANARLVPEDAHSREDLAHRIRIAGDDLQRYDVSLKAAAALAVALVPRMQVPTVKDLVAVRRGDEGFADWRSAMHNATRAMASDVTDRYFEQEAKAVLDDTVIAEAERLRRSTSRSRVLTQTARDEALQLTVGATLLSGATLAMGADPYKAAAGLGIGAVSRLLLKTIKPPNPSGAGSVLAHFEIKRP